MTSSRAMDAGVPQGPLPFDDDHYRRIRRKHVVRLFFTYLGPLILLTIYFYIQHRTIVAEGQRQHLKAIAENQANTLDLFLTERLVNLSNLLDDLDPRVSPEPELLQTFLTDLQKNSETFVDIGYFDSTGIQVTYAGPYPSLEKRNYATESWFQSLRYATPGHVFTDIYLGFRQRPHFTIGVSETINGQPVILRATLDPEKIYEYIVSLEGSQEVLTSIVNKAGYYQVVTPHLGTPLEMSAVVPPGDDRLGVENVQIDGHSFTYAYNWLRTANWALIVQPAQEGDAPFLSGAQLTFIGIAAAFIVLGFGVIVVRARRLVEFQMESDRTRAQLGQAAKLASVGELAAGIAHEINNPLASISEEAGLLKDLTDPAFGETITREELAAHLDSIHESVFRCRDITRKLLGFVRQNDMDLKPYDIHKLIDGVVDGILGPEIAVANIELERRYNCALPQLVTDGNQLQQVILNIVNNAVDALEGKPGKITITTECESDTIRISLADTGKGIKPEQLDRIFMPFYTTKEVGKGTGLGLSVSYGIIKSLGGKIEVESEVNKGSEFTIILPLSQQVSW